MRTRRKSGPPPHPKLQATSVSTQHSPSENRPGAQGSLPAQASLPRADASCGETASHVEPAFDQGSVFASVVEDLNKLLTSGGISKAELARRLPAQDILLLGQTIGAASWYDIRAYTRMNELLRDVDGGGSNDYLRERGRQTARRLLEAGFYAQLEFLHRAEVGRTTGARARFEAFGRDLRKLSTLSGAS